MTDLPDAQREQENAAAIAEFESLMQRRMELIEDGRGEEAAALDPELQQACDRYFATITDDHRRALHYVEPGKRVTWVEWLGQELLELEERHSDLHFAGRRSEAEALRRELELARARLATVTPEHPRFSSDNPANWEPRNDRS